MQTLFGCEYNELNKYTPVLNLNSLQGTIWMSIPKKLCKFQLYEVHDISKQVSKEVDFYNKIERDSDHPWMRIPLDILNLRSGKHVYKFIFYDPRSNEFYNLFMSYISQDDNPETPYVYMKGRGNPNPDTNTWKDGKYSEDFFNDLRKDVEDTYGYDPLMYSGYSKSDYCSMCTTYDCDNCQYNK